MDDDDEVDDDAEKTIDHGAYHRIITHRCEFIDGLSCWCMLRVMKLERYVPSSSC